MIISGINLTKMIKDFQLCIDPACNRNMKEIQQELPLLIKLVNEQMLGQKKSTVQELNLDGFVEYLVQHAHQYFNVHQNTLQDKRTLTAAELLSHLVGQMKEANQKYNLRLNQRYFEETGAQDPQEKLLIDLLNQKIAEDKDFKVPDGFKKVQDFVITNQYVADPRLKESERMSREILDQLLADQFGIRTLKQAPVQIPVTRVVVDQNAGVSPPRNSSKFRLGHRNSQSAIRSNQSMSSVDYHGQAQINDSGITSSPHRKRPPLFLSPNQRAHKKQRSMIRPELQLLVAQAEFQDRNIYLQCAGILESVLTAVERGDSVVNLDSSIDFVDPVISKSVILPSSKSGPAPRYLNYVSKRSRQQKEREASERAAQEAPLDKEAQKKRQQQLKESIAKHAKYLEEQREKMRRESEEKQREQQKSEQAKFRTNRFKEKSIESVKAQIQEAKKKKVEDKAELARQESEARKAIQRAATMAMAEQTAKIQETIRLRHEKAKADAEAKALALERQQTLPALSKKYTFRKQSKESVRVALTGKSITEESEIGKRQASQTNKQKPNFQIKTHNKDLEERSYRLTTGERSKKSNRSADRQSAVLSGRQTPEQEERKESFTSRSKKSIVNGIKSVLSELRKSVSSKERSDKGSARSKKDEAESGAFDLAPDSPPKGSSRQSKRLREQLQRYSSRKSSVKSGIRDGYGD